MRKHDGIETTVLHFQEPLDEARLADIFAQVEAKQRTVVRIRISDQCQHTLLPGMIWGAQITIVPKVTSYQRIMYDDPLHDEPPWPKNMTRNEIHLDHTATTP